ncbi:hypothetical protein L3Y34_011217 [Caenorhabditis briggsae]|uniref:Uncharacterized protein n=1 Tax=Caenorhabditis briggsae TaxID=6238 RepID=A0AAE9CTQ3_CAEBR|nr:hypothetical protein L3Y34_011217 [Caenorhabditis briggsae]
MNISGFPPQYSLILHLKVLTFIGHDGLSVVIALEERTTVHTYWRIIDFLPSDTDVCNKKNLDAEKKITDKVAPENQLLHTVDISSEED